MSYDIIHYNCVAIAAVIVYMFKLVFCTCIVCHAQVYHVYHYLLYCCTLRTLSAVVAIVQCIDCIGGTTRES